MTWDVEGVSIGVPSPRLLRQLAMLSSEVPHGLSGGFPVLRSLMLRYLQLQSSGSDSRLINHIHHLPMTVFKGSTNL